jgi:hypothetical protein
MQQNVFIVKAFANKYELILRYMYISYYKIVGVVAS